jgi:hypothetical protein
VERIDHYSPLRFGQPVHASLADYDRHYSHWRGQRYRLERSPVYFDGGRELVDAVARDLPDLRVLILLRDPSGRLWSGYRDKVSRGRLPDAMSFQTYVERSMTLRANGTDRYEGNRYFRTLSSGLYAEHLEPWLTRFGDRARVLFVEDLATDARGAVARLLTWLDLDPDADPESGGRSRAERGAAVIAGAGLARQPREEIDIRRGRAMRATGSDLVRRVARPWIPRQSDRMRHRVEQIYARPNRELAELLSDAGYDRLPAWLRTG